MSTKKKLSSQAQQQLFSTLKARFEKHMERHKELNWDEVSARLQNNGQAAWSIHLMEETGGEPDVVGYDSKTDEYIFCDCAPESPKGRRSICFDGEALESRKEHKPADSALDMAASVGIEILSEDEYRQLQQLGPFDTKTSSWIRTPEAIRKLGGALFMDRRYNHVFVYHNGAESYYAARGFRGSIKI